MMLISYVISTSLIMVCLQGFAVFEHLVHSYFSPFVVISSKCGMCRLIFLHTQEFFSSVGLSSEIMLL